MKRPSLSCTFISLHLVVLALAVSGCSSTKPASASFASVVIHNHSADQIQTTTAAVFRENGYGGTADGKGNMLFQKEGSQANNLAYNGVVGTSYGAQTLVRVRAQLIALEGGSHRLQCHTYMVRNAGDPFFEEESKLSNLRSGPYQKMLNEVAKRLP